MTADQNARDEIYVTCGSHLSFLHDHRPNHSGLDDGPDIATKRKNPPPKSPEVMSDIRARAWATRRAKYGRYGHR